MLEALTLQQPQEQNKQGTLTWRGKDLLKFNCQFSLMFAEEQEVPPRYSTINYKILILTGNQKLCQDRTS